MADEVDFVVPTGEVEELDENDPSSQVLLYALDEAAEKLEQQGAFEPFTVLQDGDDLYIEEIIVEDEEEVFERARRTVFQMEKLAQVYVFVYDGYVDMEEGPHDAIIAEWAKREDAQAQVLAWLYTPHDEHVHFESPLLHLGETESLFSSDPA